jgi:hypothetical protein
MYAATLTEDKTDAISMCIACTRHPPHPGVYDLVALVLGDEDVSQALREITIELLQHLHDSAMA